MFDNTSEEPRDFHAEFVRGIERNNRIAVRTAVAGAALYFGSAIAAKLTGNPWYFAGMVPGYAAAVLVATTCTPLPRA